MAPVPISMAMGNLLPAEKMTLDLFLDLAIQKKSGADYLAAIAQAYMKAPADGVVGLKEIFSASYSGAGGQAALLGTCDNCPFSGDKRFKRGDANCDGDLTLSDPVFIQQSLFLGGQAPNRMDAADADNSGVIDGTDPVYLTNYMFFAGPKPPKPFEYRGLDPAPDDLDPTCDLLPERFQESKTARSGSSSGKSPSETPTSMGGSTSRTPSPS